MVKRFWLFTSVILTLIFASLVSAQDDNWDVLIFAQSEILRVTADGFGDSIALPDAVQNMTQGSTYYNVAITPDEQYFLFVDEDQEGTGFTATLNIADLASDDCCRTISAPDEGEWEVINLLGLSPDGSKIVINFLNAYIRDGASLLAILDIETGEYVTSFDPYTTLINSNAIFFIDWDDNGIEIKPSCFPCDASADGQTMLWNPETNEMIADYGYNIAFAGSILANGETIQAIQHPDYPISNADSMFDPANIIEYFQLSDRENTKIVYFNPDNINLIKPEWVIDGQAYIIQEPFAEGVTVVWRDGQTDPFQFENPQMFLTGTPDGWLMINLDGTQLEHYKWNGNSFEQHAFVNASQMKLLSSPQLGSTATGEMIPVITD